MRIYFGGAGMKHVTTEYGVDYQSFRAAEAHALYQALYADGGENVENFNRLQDRAIAQGMMRLIEERIHWFTIDSSERSKKDLNLEQ